ncbi:phosphoribosylglycinamide formyltransferase [Thiomonas bhubaneswarensis]|uniref:Phosphoribosylglycinamide formyltransferase n=1 Tax=Thiomonas bhubaneswarensis TaxID=339866 RepID=A0A0K6I2W4_9BURK|nr:phosphoribosylglycinamide formyltransferase [Thiomonas bhubaneswarensis]CUA97607.1 formyltetrahydrofolate-dependent phosphoribosylglycinamide formyltransferase [Thiomonas bhubaneswarensis]
MKNLVLLISGRGSNLQSILQAQREQGWEVDVRGVISNRADAAGLEVARAFGVPTQVIAHNDFASREAFDQALAEAIEALQPDVIALCGFMRVLGASFVERFAGCLVNIHPSLLPAFSGLHTHARALQEGVKWHGATVHLVSSALDHGPILAQAAVPVLDGDTLETLAARVLLEEHRIYPPVVRALLEGRVQIDGLRTRILPATESPS